MREAGYTAVEMKAAGYEAKRVSDAGYSANEASEAGFTVPQLFAAGYAAGGLRSAGHTALALREAVRRLSSSEFEPSALSRSTIAPYVIIVLLRSPQKHGVPCIALVSHVVATRATI